MLKKGILDREFGGISAKIVDGRYFSTHANRPNEFGLPILLGALAWKRGLGGTG